MIIRHSIGNFVRSKYFSLLIIPMVLLEIAILYRFFISGDRWIPERPPSSFEKQAWIIYNAGYANPPTDNKWGNWKTKKNNLGASTNEPPFELKSRVFPQLGLYSSHNKFLIKKHMRMIARNGIDGVIVNWLPQQIDSFIDESVKIIFKQARKIGVSVALQIMNYEGRDNKTLTSDVEYIRANYAYENIYLKFDRDPIIFIQEPHKVRNVHKVTTAFSSNTFFVAMVEDNNEYNLAIEEDFRGIYVDVVNENNPLNPSPFRLEHLEKDTIERGMVLIPKVITEYQMENTVYDITVHTRNNGKYYRESFENAIKSGARIVLIDSFNNWQEGTNIEPVVAKPDFPLNNVTWSDDQDPEFYMKLTKKLVEEFKKA